MKPDLEHFFNIQSIVNLGAKNMDLMPAPDKFFDQVECLRRAAAGRRKERLVR